MLAIAGWTGNGDRPPLGLASISVEKMKRRAGESKKKKKKQLTELQQKRARQRGLTTKEWERQRREKLKKKEKKLSAADGGPKNRCKERFKLCLRRAGLAPTKKLALTGQAAELAQLLRFTNRSTFFLFSVTCELWHQVLLLNLMFF